MFVYVGRLSNGGGVEEVERRAESGGEEGAGGLGAVCKDLCCIEGYGGEVAGVPIGRI